VEERKSVAQNPLNLSTPQPLNSKNLSTQKKPGGENSFSPRVEVIDWNYETAS
jgi:hypothetical protein